MKYNQNTWDNLKQIFSLNGYEVRLEKEVKSRFKSGYCVLEDRKLIIINKFLSLEGRIQVLVDIVLQLGNDIQEDRLNDNLRKFYKQYCLQKTIHLK